MKTVLLVIMILAALCRAQDAPNPTAPTTTDTLSNGRRWRASNGEEKIVWVIAYRDGLMAAFIAASNDVNPPDRRAWLISRMRTWYPETLSYGEVSSALDHFYETPENRPIPISLGMSVVVMNSIGVKQPTIDDYVSSLRQDANKSSHQEK